VDVADRTATTSKVARRQIAFEMAAPDTDWAQVMAEYTLNSPRNTPDLNRLLQHQPAGCSLVLQPPESFEEVDSASAQLCLDQLLPRDYGVEKVKSPETVCSPAAFVLITL
jgi:hypothetical protein